MSFVLLLCRTKRSLALSEIEKGDFIGNKLRICRRWMWSCSPHQSPPYAPRESKLDERFFVPLLGYWYALDGIDDATSEDEVIYFMVRRLPALFANSGGLLNWLGLT